MIKLTSKERYILDIMQDCKSRSLKLSFKYKKSLEDLIEKGYIIKKGKYYKLNVEAGK